MNRPAKVDSPKKATNVTLPIDLVEDAKKLGINLSQACEAAIAAEVSKAKGEAWRIENKAAIEAWNAWVRVNGLPLAKYRKFMKPAK